MAKNKAQLIITIDEIGQVNVVTSTQNLVTNLGMLGVAGEILKSLCGGKAQEVEESPIIQPPTGPIIPNGKRF